MKMVCTCLSVLEYELTLDVTEVGSATPQYRDAESVHNARETSTENAHTETPNYILNRGENEDQAAMNSLKATTAKLAKQFKNFEQKATAQQNEVKEYQALLAKKEEEIRALRCCTKTLDHVEEMLENTEDDLEQSQSALQASQQSLEDLKGSLDASQIALQAWQRALEVLTK